MSDDVRRLSDQCQKLVDETLDNPSSIGVFTDKLRDLGISPTEGKDYIEQLEQRIRQQNRDGKKRVVPHNEFGDSSSSSATYPSQTVESDPEPLRIATPEGLNDEEASSYRERRNRIVGEKDTTVEPTQKELSDEVAWSVLRAKIASLLPIQSSSSVNIDDFVKFLRASTPSSSSGIPSAVLAVAPHLGTISEDFKQDSHLQKTWDLRCAFSYEKAIDPIIDLMQNRHFIDPIPRSIWRSIIQDMYVSFEKLFASMDRSYSH